MDSRSPHTNQKRGETSQDISHYSSVLDSKRFTFKDVRIQTQKNKYNHNNNNCNSKSRKKIINEDIPMKIQKLQKKAIDIIRKPKTARNVCSN
jgi:hypothetical protein